MDKSPPSILVITGPTACGKSKLSLELAERLGGQIVNADSVQVYRDFNIGSSMPEPEELARVPHHLFSVLNPQEVCSAGTFVKMAQDKLACLQAKGILPIVVGGTGLYLRSLLCGLAPVENISSDAKEQLAAREQQLRDKGVGKKEVSEALHQWLGEIDPQTAKKILPGDSVRIRRSLLVKLSSGKSLGELQKAHAHRTQDYRALILLMLPERELLYRAIEERVDSMLSRGLIEEVIKLRKMYPLNSHPFGAIGYRHVSLFLDGCACNLLTSDSEVNWPETDYREMVALLKRDTRRFAKRQMTWWRNQPAKLGWTVLPESIGLPESVGLAEQELSLQGNTQSNISDDLFEIIQNFLEGKAVFCGAGVFVLRNANG